MKSLTQYIQEAKKSPFDGAEFFSEYYWRIGYKYYNKETGFPTKKEIEDAFATTTNVTGDPSFGCLDGASFSKIKKDEWQSESGLSRVFGGIVSNKIFYQMLDNCKGDWYLMLRFTDKKK